MVGTTNIKVGTVQFLAEIVMNFLELGFGVSVVPEGVRE